MYIFTIVPYLYFLKTRLKGKIQRVSWFLVYFVPNILLYLYFTDFEFSFNNLSIMIISLILINYIYDNGYIQNDVILTKKEKNPTIRLDIQILENVRLNISKIFIFRFVISILILYILYFLIEDIQKFMLLLAISTSLQILYLIYNSVRSVLNLYLILPLSYIRFYGFIVPFVNYENLLEFIILTTFIYPFSKFLEFTKQLRYKYAFLSKMVGNIDLFRIKYYLISTVLFLLAYVLFEIEVVYLVIIIYYLFFRLLAYIGIKKINTVKKEILYNSKKDFR
ncbi:hypothetical protein AAX26_01342 [Aliarcobacter thereius]|uniref:hypothetical protein n=1 Tax=Aliarcobacter thereius TaxID=544718 RepID=UPI000827587A|nr:hypothetical protein [Aliarcobacter thereius]OCL87034.1 hypothetical protein AAX26_01342 [Aliarcobacter thereius]